MNLLAFEFSSAQSSLALFTNGHLTAEHSWEPENRRHEHSLRYVTRMLEDTGVSFEDLDLYATGRGPGNYSGMRIALSIAQSLALPDRKPVFAVSSGEALARQTAKDCPGRPIAVAGDARRGKIWLGLFHSDPDGLTQNGQWELRAPDELRDVVQSNAVLVTSDWTRLDPIVQEHGLSNLSWIKENRYPAARAVGELVLERTRAKIPSDPLTPLYMHRAVAQPASLTATDEKRGKS